MRKKERLKKFRQERKLWSSHVRKSETALDSEFYAVDQSRFQVLDSSLCQWNLDSGFQSSVGFQIPWAEFQIPRPRIWLHEHNFPGFRNPINGSETNLGLVIKLALNLPGKDKDKLINIWISYIWTASIGTPKVSRIRQTANGKRQIQV